MEDAEPAVVFDRIEKSFFGVKVLKGVSFGAVAGRILGLVGENGAGKSTLMNILGGNLEHDAGDLRLHGARYAPRSPNDARAAGIAFVHQELNLFPNLNIAENLFLTKFPLLWQGTGRVGQHAVRGLPWIDRKVLRSRAGELLREVGLERAPSTAVERLTAGERQLVEIARALGSEARVLILDEPTTSLSGRECERLFALMLRLRARGITLIYISHALGDVLRLCDDILVLRDGEVAGGGPAGGFTHDRLVSLMVGRELNRLYPERRAGGGDARSSEEGTKSEAMRTPAEKAVLEVRSLNQRGIVRNISFSLAAGEVLGIAGLMGAGRSELVRIVFGLDPHSGGEIRLEGRLLRGSPRSRIRQGLALLTEDRRQDGLCLEASVAENLTLAALPRYARGQAGWLDRSRLEDALRRIRAAVRLSPGAADGQPVRTLSGGNQQKVVLGKWLLAEPRVLILDEPTRGIDVGAKFEIYQLVHQMADRGTGVLVVSSEIEELIGICDRILVMRSGEIAAEFLRPEFDAERVLAAAVHASQI